MHETKIQFFSLLHNTKPTITENYIKPIEKTFWQPKIHQYIRVVLDGRIWLCLLGVGRRDGLRSGITTSIALNIPSVAASRSEGREFLVITITQYNANNHHDTSHHWTDDTTAASTATTAGGTTDAHKAVASRVAGAILVGSDGLSALSTAVDIPGSLKAGITASAKTTGIRASSYSIIFEENVQESITTSEKTG